MEQLIVLGTGNAMVTRCYNTCFAISDGAGEYLLVDAGGGNGILSQMEKAGVDIARVHDMIVTHEHCDHLLGVTWILRKVGTMMLAGKYEKNLRIYCHKNLIPTIKAIAEMTLQAKFTNLIGDRILLIPISDGDNHRLLACDVTFFDIHSSKAEQFGFSIQLKNGKTMVCLGDEPYNPICEPYIKGCDWMLSEAFCMYAQRDKFKPYEKHHSTVREACLLAEEMQVPNLVLWHTEDKNYDRRKELYMAEGVQYYSGNLQVPYDLEVIDLK